MCVFHPQYGPVFSFTMVGSTFTYLLGSEAATLLFNSKNEDLNAEDVYSRLTTPVFGKGVAYDVPNPVSVGNPTRLALFRTRSERRVSLWRFPGFPGTEEDVEDRTEHRPFQGTREDNRSRNKGVFSEVGRQRGER